MPQVSTESQPAVPNVSPEDDDENDGGMMMKDDDDVTAYILYSRDGRAIFWFGNGAKGHRVQKSCVGGRPFSLVAEQRPSFVCRWATF